MALAAAPGPRRDLDAEVPPGPPAEWARLLPVLTPLFPGPRTRPREPAKPGPAVDTAAEPREGTRADDARLLAPASLAQLITVDITSHIAWTDPQRRATTALQPASAVDLSDRDGQALRIYWLGLVPMLRLWFHPEQVSRAEAIAHLVELGEAAWPALQAARTEADLAAVCREVGKRIGVPGNSAAKPIEGSSPYERMMFRVVERELAAAFPYDPKGGFGRRLEWLGDELVPYVAGYAQHEDPFLRRNAVAALALFRHRSIPDRLSLLAGASPDPVVRFRALALLGRGADRPGSPASLGSLLEKCRDEVEAVRIVRTIGELRDPALLSAVLAYAKKNEASSDAAMAALGAVSRIGSAGAKGEALAWAREVRRQAKGGRFRDVGFRGPAPPVDRPDGEGLRASVFDQIALAAIARMAPADPKLEAEMLAWLEPRPADPSAPPPGLGKLARVSPVAQIDFLEGLAALGPRGAEALEAIAQDRVSHPAVRATALRLLPSGRRTAIARDWALARSEGVGLSAAALEVLDATDDAQAVPAALAFLEAQGFGKRPAGGLASRAATAVAVRALAARGALPADRVLDFLLRLRKTALAAEAEEDRLRTLVQAMVGAAASGLTPAEVRDRAVELVAFAYESRADPNLAESWKEGALGQILGMAAAVRERRNDAAYLGTVAKAIEGYLGTVLAPAGGTRREELGGDVPLEELVIFAAGRMKDPRCADLLARELGEAGFAQRAVACLALAGSRAKRAGPALVPCLGDEDPYVRVCAYRALRQLTGKDFFADFLAGDSVSWATSQLQYKKCLEN